MLTISKVKSEGFVKLERAILASHPLDTPEIVAITADQLEPRYLAKILKEKNGAR